MKRNLKILVPLAVLSILILFFFIMGFRTQNFASGNSVKDVTAITLDNFEQILSQNEMIKSLPNNAKVELVLHNLTFERDYVLSRNGVVQGSLDNPDMVLTLPVSYLDNLTTDNFCGVVKTANKNRDLGFESSQGMFGLMFKYRGMIKYRSCVA
jgi:hypothetical protein